MPDLALLRQITALQSLTVLFVVAVFLILHRRVHREEFFWCWSWAFAAYGCSLFLSWVSLHLGNDWTVSRYAVVMALSAAAFLQIPFMLCGTEAFQTRTTPRRIPMRAAIIIAAILGAALIPLSMLAANHVTQYSIRTAPRHGFLAITFFYASWVFFQAARNRKSRGALSTAVACFVYAAIRALWAVQMLPGVPVWESLPLTVLNLLSVLAFAFSAVLLVLERYGEEKERIALFERILPTCSLCGVVRDDTGQEHGSGEWMDLKDYVIRRTATQLSHTLCPNCVATYRKEQGLD